MVKDNISDFLVMLKNAGTAGKPSVSFTHTKLILAISELLQKEGYVGQIERIGKKGKKLLEVGINYNEAGVPKITNIRRVSKLSRRVYEKAKNLRSTRSGLGHFVLSTPKGIMTDKTARKEKVGGEILFRIW